MRSAATIMAILFVLTCAGRALAHGVRHAVIEGGTVVRASYDDDRPMAFCDVAVFAPDDEAVEHQTGTTDRNGCFAFLSDTDGVWKVTVDDGMGHLVDVEIAIDPEGVQRVNKPASADRLSGVVVGVSVLFGCFGLYAMCSNRRRRPAGITNTKEN